MKKYIIGLLILFSSFSSYGQLNIGNNLEQIKLEDSTGTLEVNPNGTGFIYVYDNKYISTLFLYFLNINKICYSTSIKPYTKVSKKYWVDGLKKNKDWVKVKPKLWEMDFGDGISIECNQLKGDKKEDLFIFLAKVK